MKETKEIKGYAEIIEPSPVDKCFKIITTIIAIFWIVLAIILIFNGATTTALISFLAGWGVIGWFSYALEQEARRKLIRYVNFLESKNDIVQKLANWNVDKIIEMSDKRMVNGLKDEDYIKFINEVLATIKAFSERTKATLNILTNCEVRDERE